MLYSTRIRSCLITLLLCFVLLANAQVNLVFNANAHGRDIRGLSFLQIMSSIPEPYTGTLHIEVKNLTGSGLVVRLVVPNLVIRSGNNIIPANKLISSNIHYASSEEGNYLRQTGLMPEGELEYCFKLVLSSKDNPDEIVENCFFGNNLLSSPLELVMPDNKDVFCEKRPRFTWQPPLPLAAGTTFQLKLVKVGNGQAANEAVLVNTPVIYQTNIRGYVLPFPAGTPDLEEGESYAWQVTANAKSRTTLSEIWQFTIDCPKEKPDSGSFRELAASDDGGYLKTGASLRFAVYNAYIEGPLKYGITNLSERSKPLNRLPEIILTKGMNHITLDLNKVPGVEEDQEYLLDVILPDGKKVSLRFKYEEE